MSQKLKGLFLETHYVHSDGNYQTHGVDYARIINPGKYLAKHPDFEIEIRKNPLENYPETNWDQLTSKFDFLYTSYIDSVGGYVNMALHCKKNKTPFVTDVDDNLWEVPPFSPVYATYHPGSAPLHDVSCALEDTPFVTTTNQFLKYRLVTYLNKPFEKIKVFPNYIDLNLYDYKKLQPQELPTRSSKDEIIIAYYGTNTHYADLMESNFNRAVTRILKDYPQVSFVTTGLFSVQLKTKWKRQYKFVLGEPKFENWIPLWQKILGDADIVVAPLKISDFNRSKSGIKYLEMSAAKKPGVYQDIRQYQELIKKEDQGFLANSEEQWYKALKDLVESEDLRRKVGEGAYTNVANNHTIQTHIQDYADYFKSVVSEYAGFSNLAAQGFVMPGEAVRGI